ncbi:7-carboxy-7-deazaguanine synthase QueE [Actinobacillus delphinicola]|uniref:7-carboxy-7-deazaguanine synthase n=1 Tax=Actinobacillus delphinicola TaxID=51161 RepID=A0A448TSX6_9PAST|nr:7-carboxy-7-deazaguanine synthase QueE [Actinobacillus delphinicola]VEJ08933.1 radical SAM domain-containing protein [Actinobacillus delphinicola]
MQNLVDPSYAIVEIFESLQGEGANCGMPAIFLRFGKCNLRCTWCDTPYEEYQSMTMSEILTKIEAFNAKNIIVTGGEPAVVPNIDIILQALKKRGYFLAIETNGLQEVPAEIDYIATSPKAQYAKMYAKQCLSHADEVRIVVDDKDNPEKFVQFCEFIRANIPARFYFLSPCDNEGEMNLHQTLNYLGKLNQNHSEMPWLLSLQTHKLVGIE